MIIEAPHVEGPVEMLWISPCNSKATGAFQRNLGGGFHSNSILSQSREGDAKLQRHPSLYSGQYLIEACVYVALPERRHATPNWTEAVTQTGSRFLLDPRWTLANVNN